jgi:hypothetical protein
VARDAKSQGGHLTIRNFLVVCSIDQPGVGGMVAIQEWSGVALALATQNVFWEDQAGPQNGWVWNIRVRRSTIYCGFEAWEWSRWLPCASLVQHLTQVVMVPQVTGRCLGFVQASLMMQLTALSPKIDAKAALLERRMQTDSRSLFFLAAGLVGISLDYRQDCFAYSWVSPRGHQNPDLDRHQALCCLCLLEQSPCHMGQLLMAASIEAQRSMLPRHDGMLHLAVQVQMDQAVSPRPIGRS